MPQCKRNYCKKPAVPYGKQYCEEHLIEYHERRDRDAKRKAEREAPLIECISYDCYNKIEPDEMHCSTCEEEFSQQEYETNKRESLREAETVEDLRDWIYEYVL